MMLTPPARASEHSPCQMARQAKWMATSDEEQAVSIARLGPRRSSTYEIRFASMVIDAAVVAWWLFTTPRFSGLRNITIVSRVNPPM